MAAGRSRKVSGKLLKGNIVTMSGIVNFDNCLRSQRAGTYGGKEKNRERRKLWH